MTRSPFIVGFGGSTRPGSSGELMVRAVLREAEKKGATTRVFGGSELAALPHYAPELPTRNAGQLEFVDAVRNADGVVIGSPGYHGGVSGLVKNAIDLLEDLSADKRVYLSERAVGLIVVSAGWQACGVTLQAMRAMVHALRGWPTPIGIVVNPLEQEPFDSAGQVVNPSIKEACILQAQQVLWLAEQAMCSASAFHQT